jgi:hypothetical protein
MKSRKLVPMNVGSGTRDPGQGIRAGTFESVFQGF